MLTSIGTDEFLYNSLRYYGEPSAADIASAYFLLYAKEFDVQEEPTIDAKESKRRFSSALNDYGIQCKVEISNKIIASAMVDNSKKTSVPNRQLYPGEQGRG